MIKEACVETFEEAISAKKNGADRVELCSDLANDGLTPAFDLMKKTVAELNIPVMVMIRPRAGNFVYSDEEIRQMKFEIELAKKAGAYGVVFGLLTNENKIDKKNTAILCNHAHPLQITFHKAIDIVEDPVEGVMILKKINGITRILTSGGKSTAREGAITLIQMLKAANGKITILVAGKVNDKNIDIIDQRIGAYEYHGRKIVGDL